VIQKIRHESKHRFLAESVGLSALPGTVPGVAMRFEKGASQ